MARVLRNGKRIRRLTQAEVVNDSGRELPEVSTKHCESVRSNGKFIRRLTKRKYSMIVVESYRKYPEGF